MQQGVTHECDIQFRNILENVSLKMVFSPLKCVKELNFIVLEKSYIGVALSLIILDKEG